MATNDTQNILSTPLSGSGEPIPASKISYDNSDSGLQATKVQGAIDELAGDITNLTGDDIAYDNTDTGLLATDVQGAIDEIDAAVDNLVAEKLPILPDEATAGTYVLKATKADDTVTYSWVLEV